MTLLSSLCLPSFSSSRRSSQLSSGSSSASSSSSTTLDAEPRHHPEGKHEKSGGRAMANGEPGEQPCVFCDVCVEKGFKIIYENEGYVVFRDRTPGSKVHLLAVPKRHIDNVKSLTTEDIPLLKDLALVGTHALDLMGVPRHQQRMGFHIPPFYSINHLHLHLLSLPCPFPSNLKYCPTSSSSSIPPLRLPPLTEPPTPPLTGNVFGIGKKVLVEMGAEVETAVEGAEGDQGRRSRKADYARNEGMSFEKGKKKSERVEEEESGSGGSKDKGKWVKAKGWCWFVGLDQTIAIISTGQAVRVGSVKVPLAGLVEVTRRMGEEEDASRRAEEEDRAGERSSLSSERTL